MRRLRTLSVVLCVFAAVTFVPLVAAAGGGCHPDNTGELTQARAESDGTAAAVAIERCAFEPAVLYVDEGAEVTWHNKDPVPHTVTGVNLSWGTERMLNDADTVTERFSKAGVFPYYCLVHPGMVGAIVVGDPNPDDVGNLSAAGITSPQDPAEPGSAPVSDTESSSSFPLLAVVAGLLVIAGAVLFGRSRITSRSSVPH